MDWDDIDYGSSPATSSIGLSSSTGRKPGQDNEDDEEDTTEDMSSFGEAPTMTSRLAHTTDSVTGLRRGVGTGVTTAGPAGAAVVNKIPYQNEELDRSSNASSSQSSASTTNQAWPKPLYRATSPHQVRSAVNAPPIRPMVGGSSSRRANALAVLRSTQATLAGPVADRTKRKMEAYAKQQQHTVNGGMGGPNGVGSAHASPASARLQARLASIKGAGGGQAGTNSGRVLLVSGEIHETENENNDDDDSEDVPDDGQGNHTATATARTAASVVPESPVVATTTTTTKNKEDYDTTEPLKDSLLDLRGATHYKDNNPKDGTKKVAVPANNDTTAVPPSNSEDHGFMGFFPSLPNLFNGANKQQQQQEQQPPPPQQEEAIHVQTRSLEPNGHDVNVHHDDVDDIERQRSPTEQHMPATPNASRINDNNNNAIEVLAPSIKDQSTSSHIIPPSPKVLDSDSSSDDGHRHADQARHDDIELCKGDTVVYDAMRKKQQLVEEHDEYARSRKTRNGLIYLMVLVIIGLLVGLVLAVTTGGGSDTVVVVDDDPSICDNNPTSVVDICRCTGSAESVQLSTNSGEEDFAFLQTVLREEGLITDNYDTNRNSCSAQHQTLLWTAQQLSSATTDPLAILKANNAPSSTAIPVIMARQQIVEHFILNHVYIRFTDIAQTTTDTPLPASWTTMAASSSSSVCTRQGVTCDPLGRVIGLDLAGMATTPVSLQSLYLDQLSHLETLRLSRNRLTGTVLRPHERLRDLDLSDNDLTGGLSMASSTHWSGLGT